MTQVVCASAVITFFVVGGAAVVVPLAIAMAVTSPAYAALTVPFTYPISHKLFKNDYDKLMEKFRKEDEEADKNRKFDEALNLLKNKYNLGLVRDFFFYSEIQTQMGDGSVKGIDMTPIPPCNTKLENFQQDTLHLVPLAAVLCQNVSDC